MGKYICFMDFEYTTTGNTELDLKNDNIEIISLAGVIINEKNETVDEFHEIIRPIKNVVLHPFCTELTGITQDMVDEASFFSTVADNFMDFIEKYRKEELYIYVWGNCDSLAIDRTFKITRYSGEFEYIREKIVNIQKRICCSITHKGKVIKSVWSLQNIKSVFNLPVSTNQHNALYDARDLRDVYIAYKNKFPKNYKFIQYIYERSLANKIKNIHNKTVFFNRIPGEVKYGLANLFKNASIEGIKAEGAQFNKKTMLFKNYEYCITDENSIKKIEKMDTEIIRYSNIQMVTKINQEKYNAENFEGERLVFTLYFAGKSNRLNGEYVITPVFKVPIIPRNIAPLTVFAKKVMQHVDVYDGKTDFEDIYNIMKTINNN